MSVLQSTVSTTGNYINGGWGVGWVFGVLLNYKFRALANGYGDGHI